MNNTKKTICYLFVIIILILSASGCNTFRGMGQDIEDLGQAMQGV